MTKLETLVSQISADILEEKYGKSGELFPPIRELAVKLGVSYVTLQKAYLQLHSRHLLLTIGKKTYLSFGTYHPESDFAKTYAQSNLFGIYVNNIDNSFFSKLVATLSRQLAQRDCTLIILSNAQNAKEEEKIIKSFLDLGVKGIFICPTFDKELKAFYRYFLLPMVFISREMESLEYNTVSVNNVNIGKQAARHLTSYNYTDHIYIGLKKHREEHRLKGFAQALKEYGTPLNETQIFYANDNHTLDDASIKAMYHIIENSNKRIGIFCYHDLIAVEIHKFLHRAKIKTPERVGLVGVDNLQISYYVSPTITTISYSYDKLASASIDMMNTLIQSLKKRQPIQYITQSLNVRETTQISNDSL